jgi:hypothetical protein
MGSAETAEQAAETTTTIFNPDWLGRIEWTLAILISAAVLFLLFVRATNAGGLWRDESGTVQLAQMSTISEIIDYFDHQTFPPLVPLMVRIYIRLFGGSDAALRYFGFAAGMALIGAAWINARAVGKSVPLLSLALFGLSPTFLTWGTTVSGYGFGAIFVVLAFVMTAKLLLKPTPSIIFGAFIATLGSHQFVIGNLTLVVTIGLSALIVAVMHRAYKSAVTVATITICSILIGALYLRIFSSGEWRILLQQSCHLSDLWREFTRAYGAGFSLTWVFRGCFIAAVIAGAWTLGRGSLGRARSNESTVLLFALLVALFSPVAYVIALLLLGYRTHQWHYLLILALLAVAIDTIFMATSRVRWVRVARLSCAILAAIAVAAPAWEAVHQRQTNIDIVAKKVSGLAKPHDLIVVAPWQFGISFNRYYGGEAPWVTLPNIDDHRIHRYDLMLEKMTSSQPIDDVLNKIGRTLASGNRVWVVGEIRSLAEGQQALWLPPAPKDRFGWDNAAYTESWIQQMSVFLRQHGERGETVHLAPGGSVNEYEDVPLLVVQGWQ